MLAWLASHLTSQVRQYLYGIVTAAVPILVVVGVLDTNDATLWLALAASVLGTGTAVVHVAAQRADGTLD